MRIGEEGCATAPPPGFQSDRAAIRRGRGAGAGLGWLRLASLKFAVLCCNGFLGDFRGVVMEVMILLFIDFAV